MQANGQKSHGPRTSAGKAVSRFNALKHGIFAVSRLMFDETAEDLAKLTAEYHERHNTSNRVLNRFGGQWFHKLCGAANPGCSRLLGGYCAVRDVDFRQAQKLSGGRFPAKSRRPQNG
jgi:hypothetical protein